MFLKSFVKKCAKSISNYVDSKYCKNVSNARESALSEIVSSIAANGYQVVVSGSSHAPNKHSKIPIVQGEH